MIKVEEFRAFQDAERLCQSQALRVEDIHPSPTNPRKTFPADEMAEMIASVKRHGVMQAILVRPWPERYTYEGTTAPKYELIAGERRYRAAKGAGLTFIPGTVRELDDRETLELQIIENLHRKDLNELEEAEGYELMIKDYGYSAEDLAEKIDKSKAYIFARRKLTAACPTAREAFRDGTIDASRLLLLARIPTAALQERALKEITTSWQIRNYKEAAEHIQGTYMLKLDEAPFAPGDDALVASAGNCHACPKRTGSNPELYPDVKSAHICTDPDCFAAKKAAHYARQKAEAKAAGRPLIEGEAAAKVMPDRHTLKGYVNLEEKCYEAYDSEAKRYRTYREVLADKALPTTLIEAKDGSLIEAVDAKILKEAAPEAVKQKSSSDGDKERQAKEKAENDFRRRLFTQIRTALQEQFAESRALTRDELAQIARQYWSCLWHEYQKRVAALWVETEGSAHERIGQVPQLIEQMDMGSLARFLFDLALIGMTNVSSYQVTDTPPILLDTAKRLHLSPDAIRLEIKAEQEAKDRAKTQGKSKGKDKAVKPAKAGETTYQEGDHFQVTNYPASPDKVGTVARIITISQSISTGEDWFTSVQANGQEIVTTADEMAPSTAEAFEAQKPRKGDFAQGDRIRIRSESGLIAAGKLGTFVMYEEFPDEGDVVVQIDEEPCRYRCYSDEIEPAPEDTTSATETDKDKASTATSTRPPVRYRHPEECTLEWTGRGRKPAWVIAWLKQNPGRDLADLEIPHSSSKTAPGAACDIAPTRCTKALELQGLDVDQSTATA